MTKARYALLVLSLWVVPAQAACREKPTGEARAGREVTRDQFIETYVALLRAEAAAADSAEARERRASVLERRELTADDLEGFAREHADDPAMMSKIWREIETRIRESGTTDTVRAEREP